MSFPCSNALHACACLDDPQSNWSSEAPDNPVFCAIVNFAGDPPLGTCPDQLNCTEVCCSLDSQEDAYLCALRKAQECVWGTWAPNTCPPPDDPPMNCPPICPPQPPFCS